jgi:hypothetical protein
MPLDAIPFDSVSEEHFQRLVQDKEQEGKTVEFKQQLPGNADADKKEFLADFTSFSNTAGGDLIYGIRESKGIAEDVLGLTGDLDAELTRLENIIRTGIQPRVTRYSTKLLPLANGNRLLIFRIPRSWALPHRVTLGGHDKFYGRNSTGKYALDVPELRSLFLLSETTAERIRNFRAERVSLVLSGQTPMPLAPGPTMLLHAVPFDAFTGGRIFDVSRIYGQNFQALRPLSISRGYSDRHNFDGIVTYSYIDEKTPPPSYLQLFRTGIIESADTRKVGTHGETQIWIPGQSWEDDLLQAMHQYIEIQTNIGVTSPIVFMLSLLNVKGAKMFGAPAGINDAELMVDRDHLLAPEVVAEDPTVDLGQLMKPVFDVIWNACGHAGSTGYDKDGNRKKPN